MVFKGRGFGGEGLCGGESLSREIGFGGDRPFFDRPDRLARNPVESVDEALFRNLRHGLDRIAVDFDIEEIWCGGIVVIPDAVVHHLKVPDALAGFDVDADQAFREQVVAEPVAPVEIVRSGSRG